MVKARSHRFLRAKNLGIVLLLLVGMIPVKNTMAHPLPQVSGTITVSMYVLRPNGSIDPANLLCNTDDTTRQSYGCTYFPNDPAHEYPFNANTITIAMEGDTTTATNGSQQGYLHNVVAQEMTEGSTLASYVAQAIVSRTYAYAQTDSGAITIDNSASKQVYIPYRYEGLTTSTRRQTVHNAITLPGPLYMTLPNSLEPIRAYFGQDNCAFTEQGSGSYLKSIYDPISAKDGDCRNSDYGTGYGGMGSAGVSRWGYGHTSEYNRDDLGDPWSVRWESGLLIVVHYYTGVVIRNVSGQVVTPAWRWNPLLVDWGNGSFTPPPMQANHTYNVVIQLHNSGIETWTNDTLLSYQWQSGSDTINGATSVAVGSVASGNYTSVTLPVRTPGDSGNYTLHIDMIHSNGSYFHNRESGRPWFTLDFEVCVGSKCHLVYLPFIVTSDGSSSPPPSGCTWKIDNLLEDAGYNYSQNTPWLQVNTLNGEDGAIKPLSSLRTSEEYLPGDSPYSAFLGKWNDPNHSSNDVSDQAIYQQITLPDNIVAVAIEYSSRLTTYETTDSEEYDKFFVDLQVGGLGSNSLLAARQPKYTNLYPYKDMWRRRGVAVEDGGDGLLIVNDMSRHAGKAIILVFYSEVDSGNSSTFYIDAVKLKGCVR